MSESEILLGTPRFGKGKEAASREKRGNAEDSASFKGIPDGIFFAFPASGGGI